MSKQDKILYITMLSSAVLAILFIILSRFVGTMVVVGLVFLFVFCCELTYVSIKKIRKQNRDIRNSEIEECINCDDFLNDELMKNKKHNSYDRYGFVVLSVILSVLVFYMLVHSIIIIFWANKSLIFIELGERNGK